MTAQGAPTTTTGDPDKRCSPDSRIDGRAMVVFGHEGVRDTFEIAPARLLVFHDTPLAVTVGTGGGLAGGDRFSLDIHVDPDATATVMPQAAEQIHRALPCEDDTRIETRITVGAGGTCEWLAQEAILFDRSRMRRSLEADLAPDARMLAMEMLVLGRGTRGEVYRGGLVHDSWRIRRDGRLVWADTLHVAGDFAEGGRASFGFGHAAAIATIVYAGPGAASHLDLGRHLSEPPTGDATSFDDLLILRMTREDPYALRRDVMRAAGVLRAAIFGLSPSMPPVVSS
jgi:urease accessory protein